jgi:5-methylcytosine-specific restriction endonuclease McrA
MVLTGDTKREYQRNWIAERRAAFFNGKVCVRCGSTEDLQLDHIDPAQKVTHNIWSWSQARRDAEIAKCQVLCKACHIVKTIEQMTQVQGITPYRHGTNKMYRRGCKCGLCKLWKKRVNARRYQTYLL